MRYLRTSLTAALVVILLFAACGGGDDDAAPSDGTGIEVAALEDALAGFNDEVASEFGQFSPPEYDADAEIVVGLLSIGITPVVFCDRLADYVADEGFQGVAVEVRFNLNEPALATGISGEACEPV
jgi:hypothetical protein